MKAMPPWPRLMAWALGVSVRLKIMGIALGLVFLLGFSVIVTERLSLAGILDRELQSRGIFLAGLREILDAVTRHVLLATLLVSLVGVFAAYLLTRVLTRPLLELREAARRVGAGEFAVRARVWSKDEIGQLTSAFNSMTDSLQRMQEELQRKETMRLQLLDKVMTAQEEERKRVARELHDETSQALTSLMVGLKVLETTSSIADAREQISALRELTARTLGEVHRLALELRPSVLDDWGLVVALHRYVEEFARKTGLDVDCQMVGLDGHRLPPRIEIALYRIVQEALTNVARHAGARHVSVVLKRQRASALAIVEDDGVGFDVARVMGAGAREEALGLFGMQERAALLGGALTIESRPAAGTTVFVEIPLRGESSEPDSPADRG